ncbi:MAG: amino acid adenylation domain-containing protein [Longimicrobiaceae bacterium]
MKNSAGAEPLTGQEIAVVGMAGRFPGAGDLDAFWCNLRTGVDAIARFTREELAAAGVPERQLGDPSYVPAHGMLGDAELFDAAFFGFTPREASILNPQHRVFLECAWDALERAGYATDSYEGRIGVYAAGGQNRYLLNVLSQPAVYESIGDFQVMLLNGDSIATMTSYRLNLRGPSINLQTACSSSLVAVHLACQSLLFGESDLVLAGGAHVSVPTKTGYRYSPGGILSPTGECRSFDADARGTVGGSGVGVVVLKRLEDALDDGDTVHAVIRGSAVNNDGGEKASFTVPRREGQAEVIAEALSVAGVKPEEVSYVEAHGSATEVGDPIEVAALVTAFGDTGRTGHCALGSVKSNVGHLDAAAGVAGLIKTVLALENAEIPASLHFETPNPRIDFARSPFFVNAALRPWERNGHPRRAGVSSFGMGGTNAHVVLEEAPAAEPSGPARPWELVVLSARTATALEAATDRLVEHLGSHPEQAFADVAHTLRVGRRRFGHRRVLVCRGRGDAMDALASRDPRRVLDTVRDSVERRVAFLFPGLGDHYAGMARGLYEAEPVFRREVDRCAEILLPVLGADPREVLFPGEPAPEQRAGAAPEAAGPAAGEPDLRRMLGRDGGDPAREALDRTELAHPAVFVVEYALARTWMEWGVRPELMLGHSLGEYVAATLAGVFELEDALVLVAERARLIAGLPGGAMLAVPLPEAEVLPLLREGLALAAVNSAEMCTVSGSPAAVAALEAELTAAGVACRRLNASHAFHSDLMEPVAQELAGRLRAMRLRAPEIPFVSNVTGLAITAAEATDPEYWARHLCRTVRFAEGMREVLAEGQRVLLEVGPGRTLGTFALQAGAAASSVLATLRHAYTRRSDLAQMLETAGQLWMAGVRPDWVAFAGDERRLRVRLPTYPFERHAYWIAPAAAPAVPADPAAGAIREGAGTAGEAAPAAQVPALHGRPELGVRYVAPEGEAQLRLAAVWEELLGFGGIGAHDDFFSLGGHSLLATRLLFHVKDGFGVDLPLEAVFEVPTLAGLAGRIEALREAGDPEQLPPILPVPRTGSERLPLSYAQERLWVLDQIEPGSPLYTLATHQRIRRRVDVAVAGRALSEIVRRHEVLRTVYRVVDGQTVQVVLPPSQVPLPVEDLPGVPEQARPGLVRARVREAAMQPLDLVDGPVMRARVLRFDEDDYVLLLTVHHIVMDGWSWALMFHEWDQLYAAFALGEPSPLPELPVQYADYAVWQRRILSGDRLAEHLAYWRESLRGVPSVLEVPTDRPHPAVQSYRGGLYGITIPPELLESIRELARREGATVHHVCLAAYQALLFRYTGQEDFVVGSAAANRLRPETQRLLGFFINTLPVRARLAAALTFQEVLEQVREAMLGVFAHAEVPLQMILDEVQPDRDPSRNPLVQVMFGFQTTPNPASEANPGGPVPERSAGPAKTLLPDGEVAPLGDTGTSKFDISVLVNDGTGGPASIVVEYNSDLYDRSTVERFADHFHRLLAAGAAAPETRLAELPMFGAAERARLLEAAATGPAVAAPACVPGMFSAQAGRTPGEVALVSGGEALTYAELDRDASRLAHFLRARGVGPETRVAVCLDRGLELVVSVLGVLKAGGAYVPLDPDYPAERLAYTLSDSGAALLVSRGGLVDGLSAFEGEVVRLDEAKEEIARQADEAPTSGVDVHNAAYVIYTSGSTGRPKGVVVEHASLANTLLGARDTFGLAAGEVFPAMASHAFDIWAFEVFSPLLAGGQVRLLEHQAVRDPERLLEELATVDAVHAVPALMREVVARVQAGAGTLPRMRRVFIGGDAIAPDLLEQTRAVFPEAQVWAMYGPTEGTVISSATALRPGERPGWQMVGRPLPGVGMHVLDPSGTLLPAGVPGELCLAGAGVARGYLGRAELTAERFVPDPFSGDSGARLYRTGDRVRRRADGELEFLGRVDTQVKIRGFRIEPGEIEAVLLEQEMVREAIVVVREDGPGHKRLVAYVEPRGGVEISPAELRGRLAERLPEHMVPGAFVVMESLPLNANGKVDRRALPAPERGSLEASRVAARTEVEAILCEVLAGVLKVERIGVEDNFFELGGDSILSIQAVSRVRQRGLRLTPRQIFERPTVARLAEVVERVDLEARGAVQGLVTGEAPLTPVQRDFFAQAHPARHHFNHGLLLRPREELDAGVLLRAAAALEAHHDALRLRFRQEVDGRWTQHHAGPSARGPLTVFDLSALPAEAQKRAIERTAQQVQRSLDLEHGPLLRMGWFGLGGAETGRLLAVAHHLAVDGASWRVLLEDLELAYVQLSRGGGVALPPKTSSWKAWAERLAEHARSGVPAEEASYWSEQAAKEVAPLPVDDPLGGSNLGVWRGVPVRLTEEETGMLLHELPAAYRTQVNEVLLTGLARALARWTGQRRIRVDMEGHGREDETVGGVDVSRTVGWFTTVYPTVLELPEGDDPGTALKAVKEQLRAVPGHGIGYGLLRDGGAPGLAEAPGAEVGFNYLGQFDQSVSGEALFAFAPESAGDSMDPRSPLSHRLEVGGSVQGGRMELRIGYSAEVHRRETVERVAQWYGEELRALIAHCTSAEAGGYTPSDFPLAGLDQPALDALLGSGRGVEDVYPLSPLQEGMLFHALYAPESGVYVGQFGFVLEGPLEEDVLERAWQSAVSRHEALRAGFAWEGLPRPVQVIRRDAKLPFHREDWRGLDEADRQARLQRFLEADRMVDFELGRAPLMRLGLFRTGEEEHQLVWTHHHLIVDGWSLSLIFSDVLAAYMAYARGEAPQSGHARRYREYIAWLERQDRSRAEEFWKRALAGFDTRTPLPALRGGHGSGQGGGQGVAKLALPEERTRALQEQAAGWGVTLSTVVQGAWGLLLGRYAGAEDVVFGATSSGRPAELPGVEETVGLFINTLPVRVRLPGEAWLREWLQALQQEQTEAREYEYSPLVEVRKWSDVPAGESLFESLVVFENAPVDEAAREAGGNLGGLRVRQSMVREQANYPLVVSAQSAAQLKVEINYDLSRVDADAVERLAGHLETVLQAIAAEPGCRLSDLSLLRRVERTQLLAASRAELPEHAPACVHELFAVQAERMPGAQAVSFRGEALTYAELESAAGRLARHLRRRGVGPEVRVGICLERSLEMVVGVLGVLKAGGTYVPLDPDYPAGRLAFTLADSGAALLVSQGALVDRLPGFRGEVVRLDADREAIAAEPEGAPPSGVDVRGAAYVVYTSGSTGRPKGVVVEHASVAGTLLATRDRFGLCAGEVMPAMASFAFDVWAFEVFAPLLSGGRVRLLARETVRDVESLVEELAAVDAVHAVPALMREVVARVQAGAGTLPRMRRVFVGGDAIAPDLLEQTRAVFPEAQVWAMYGPTEGSIISSATALRPGERPDWQMLGRPLPGVGMHVLDTAGNLLPAGVPGELCLAGAGVARGYLGRAELTAERFVPDPFSGDSGARLYRTGDRVRRRADGELEFLGRVDAQFKIRGFRIEPGEIEAVLLEREDVHEAVVVVREDPAVGMPGHKRLVAYVVPREGAHLATDELRTCLAERLPEHMVPGAFVTLESLPLNANGKVDRRALPRPQSTLLERAEAYEAPRDGLEETLTAIFAEVLGVAGVGLRDSFFELGGHSLLAVRITSRLREATGARVPVAALFRSPTVELLAREVRAGGGELPLILPLRPQGSRPPIILVHPGGGSLMAYAPLVERLDADQPVYGLRSRGIEEGETPNWTIEEMARDYLDSIRQVRPSGPYRLGGWSMGGVIAFEMARQLEAAGETVEALVMIDSQVPSLHDPERSMPGDELRIVQMFAHDLGLPADRLPTPDPEARDGGEVAYLRLVLETARAAGMPPGNLELARLQHLYGIFRINLRALFDYRPASYAGRVTLLRAGRRGVMDRVFGTASYGWETVVEGGLEVRTVPGTHHGMMRSPHVEKLAQEVERAAG